MSKYIVLHPTRRWEWEFNSLAAMRRWVRKRWWVEKLPSRLTLTFIQCLLNQERLALYVKVS